MLKGDFTRTVSFDSEGIITNLFEKNKKADNPTFLGLCGIKDYESFWEHSDDESL